MSNSESVFQTVLERIKAGAKPTEASRSEKEVLADYDYYYQEKAMAKRKDKLEIERGPALPSYSSTSTKLIRRWHWHLRSAYNGKIMCAGQPIGYSSKAKAIAGWEAVAGSARNGVEIVDLTL